MESPVEDLGSDLQGYELEFKHYEIQILRFSILIYIYYNKLKALDFYSASF